MKANGSVSTKHPPHFAVQTKRLKVFIACGSTADRAGSESIGLVRTLEEELIFPVKFPVKFPLSSRWPGKGHHRLAAVGVEHGSTTAVLVLCCCGPTPHLHQQQFVGTLAVRNLHGDGPTNNFTVCIVSKPFVFVKCMHSTITMKPMGSSTCSLNLPSSHPKNF